MNAQPRTFENQDLLSYNEKQANSYTALCLRVAAVIAALMWLLNALDFFIVDKRSMNIAMVIGIFFLLLPTPLEKCGRIRPDILKYLIMSCFLVGIGCMSSVLTIHMVLVWACPVMLSCHFYKPSFTLYTFLVSLVLLFISFYLGIYIGVWDANIFHSSVELKSVAERVAYIRESTDYDVLARAFDFYYLPRASILFFVATIGTTLSRRTRRLLVRQNEIVREQEQIGAELSVGTKIQASLLPSVDTVPDQPYFDVAGEMHPAKEVGGDFYDFFMVDDTHLAVVMADVSGKGIPAALFMVVGKTLIKEHTKPGVDLGEVFTQVNRLLCESNSEELFITAFEGVLDLTTGRFDFVNAGHEPPFLFSHNESFQAQKPKHGLALGVMKEIHYEADSIFLSKGDKLFTYTDGITEATSAAQELYGMKRLDDILNRCITLPPRQILPRVLEDINLFVGQAPQFDDITMLCMEYKSKLVP